MHSHLEKFDTPTTRKFVLFGMVGGAGALLNTLVLWGLTSFGMHYLAAGVIATELAIIFNFFGNQTITFKDHQEGSMKMKFLTFQLVSMVALVCTLAVLWLLTRSFGEELLLIWNLIAIIIASLLNFTLNMKFTWNRAEVRS